MRIRVYGSAQALYCVANALYWKSFKRQIFTHLTVLKHQNTKTSLYELSKNHWVFALFEIFGLGNFLEKYYNLQSLMITLYILKSYAPDNIRAFYMRCWPVKVHIVTWKRCNLSEYN